MSDIYQVEPGRLGGFTVVRRYRHAGGWVIATYESQKTATEVAVFLNAVAKSEIQ